ncbi:hypothetical protein RRG08_020158, partial [Elysia crispata]
MADNSVTQTVTVFSHLGQNNSDAEVHVYIKIKKKNYGDFRSFCGMGCGSSKPHAAPDRVREEEKTIAQVKPSRDEGSTLNKNDNNQDKVDQ